MDLDDTLWPIAPVIETAEKALFAWLHANFPRAVERHDIESMRQLRVGIGQRFPDCAHDFSFLRHRALVEQLESAGYAGAAADDAFEVFFAARNSVTAFDDVAEALARLSRRYRLYALTNGNAELARCGFADYFSGHVSARSAGALKPDARIFARLLQECGVKANQVLHVGDDPVADVVGAMDSGLVAAWMNREARAWPPHLAPPPLIIGSLSDLL